MHLDNVQIRIQSFNNAPNGNQEQRGIIMVAKTTIVLAVIP